MSRHGFSFSQEDCYINEGRTGQDVITEALLKTGMPEQKITDELVRAIYKEKTDLFHSMGEVEPIAGVPELLRYLKAWEHSGFGKEDCCVVENAPLGIRSAKAAGLYAVGINTGPLQDDVLWAAGADQVFPNMADFQAWLETE